TFASRATSLSVGALGIGDMQSPRQVTGEHAPAQGTVQSPCMICAILMKFGARPFIGGESACPLVVCSLQNTSAAHPVEQARPPQLFCHGEVGHVIDVQF